MEIKTLSGMHVALRLPEHIMVGSHETNDKVVSLTNTLSVLGLYLTAQV